MINNIPDQSPTIISQMTAALVAVLDVLVLFGVVHVDENQKAALVIALTSIFTAIQTIYAVSQHRVQIAALRGPTVTPDPAATKGVLPGAPSV